MGDIRDAYGILVGKPVVSCKVRREDDKTYVMRLGGGCNWRTVVSNGRF
jgi:hypothetical protein